jgi:hypothetical protein
MSYRTKTKRKKPPHPVIFEYRRNWGARLLLELNSLKMTPEQLGEKIDYDEPRSIRQIINGHQGISMEMYVRIIKVVPEMRDVPVLFMHARAKQRGSPGPHRDHRYPKLGSRASRRPKE